jgi:hypothetical protein
VIYLPVEEGAKIQLLASSANGNPQYGEWRELKLVFRDEKELFGKIVNNRYMAKLDLKRSKGII